MSADPEEPRQLIYDWNVAKGNAFAGRKVLLEDETLRDGLQSPSVKTPTIEEKVSILRLIARMGIHKVNLGLPGAGSQHRSHIERLIQVVVEEKLPVQPGLAVRTLTSEIEPIVDLQQRFGINIQVNAFLGTSPIRKYVEDWDNDFLLSCIDKAVGFATDHGLPCMFVTEDTTRSQPEDLRLVYTRALERGARALCVADTAGHATPDGTRNVIRFVRGIVEDWGGDEAVEIAWHGHSDRGLALGNCLAALEAGADVLHGTALGIGERVGNAAMDQLLVNLKLLGLFEGDLSYLSEYLRRVSRATGTPIHCQYPVFGADAFHTSTGVHAAALIKAARKGDQWLIDRVYSGVPAGEFGQEQKILVGPMSGHSNVSCWLEQHGYPVAKDLVDRILRAAKGSWGPLSDADLRALAEKV
jgi:2-isopropylmalate synthase